MKKFSVLIALALLAVAGTGYAVTCAYDNVPAASLLVPHFRVARNGSTGGDIPEGGVDTLCAVTNVSSTGLIVHITVWNKYSKAVLDFNVPLTAYDVAFWRMKDILNGRLNVNPNTQSGSGASDPCGLNQGTGVYAPSTGFAATRYVRFSNPDAADRRISISRYATPAFSGSFRQRVWDSLDETQDITSFTNPSAPGIRDVDNPGCGSTTDGVYAGDFGGYLTLDVVNFCTNYFPDDFQFYTNDAIATAGWAVSGYTPNAIIGDVFYVDPAADGGNISGDPMVALEFDSRLSNWNTMNTFFGRYALANYEVVAGTAAPAAFQFIGDGREPLGSRYGFRFLSDQANGLRSWALVWRSDNYISSISLVDYNLCAWWFYGGAFGEGFYDTIHQIGAYVYDNDENSAVVSGGPSGGPPPANQYIFLESQRISLLNNGDINPGAFKGGWVDLTLPGRVGLKGAGVINYQAWVGVQHTGPGLAISVGHAAANLWGGFNCSPAIFTQAGVQP